MGKEDNKVHLDTRLILKGEKGKFIREKLDELKDEESRVTYSNTLEPILLKYFKWSKGNSIPKLNGAIATKSNRK